VSPLSLRSVVEYDVRLDMLGCLYRVPQTIAGVSERIGGGEQVGHHMKMLVSFGLVEVANGQADG
jgi:hypothetical protein